jgi:hypothetical protein
MLQGHLKLLIRRFALAFNSFGPQFYYRGEEGESNDQHDDTDNFSFNGAIAHQYHCAQKPEPKIFKKSLERVSERYVKFSHITSLKRERKEQ